MGMWKYPSSRRSAVAVVLEPRAIVLPHIALYVN